MIAVSNISLRYGKRTLFEDVNLKFIPGNCYGVIGANGAGKSTFFKMLIKNEKPDSGNITFGDTVKISYVDQSRDLLIENKSIWEEISDGLDIITVGQYQTPSRSYVGKFNFKGADQQKLIKELSGGTRQLCYNIS